MGAWLLDLSPLLPGVSGWLALCVLLMALLIALAVDGLCGEPPLRWHPVVWMGRALDALGQRVAPTQPTGRDLKSFWLAALCWCAVAALVVIAATLLQGLLQGLLLGSGWHLRKSPSSAALHPLLCAPGMNMGALEHAVRALLTALVLGLLLKPLMALALLQSEVRAVEAALTESLAAGRARLAWLVSRDVAQLSAEEVRQSAIETLAENLNDSVIAPLFWFLLLGLPGAALYRFANTADAMWATPGCAGRATSSATGSGLANGPRTLMTCCRGFPRASPRCCWRWPAAVCGCANWRKKRAKPRRPTAAGRWRRWRWR